MRELLRRRLGLVIIAIAVLLLLSATRIATFLTELWWFGEKGYQSIFLGVLWAQILLGLAFGVFLALIVAANLMVARRLRPTVIPSTPQQAIIERYRQMADPYLPWIVFGIAVLFGLTAGAAVSAQWETFLLWRNGGAFGVTDQLFDRDVGFYMFDLPWLRFVQQWLFTSLLLVTLLTAGAYYLLGAIRPEAPGEKVTPPVKVHLSVLLALVLAARAWGFWLDRFMLNFSPRGTVIGASYTDVNAQLPALNLLLVVSVIAIVLVLYNIRQRGWLLPGAGIGLLILAGIVLSGAYPAAVQRLRVDPQELDRERQYIEFNLEATRDAWGMNAVQEALFDVRNDLSSESAEREEITLSNIRLWDEGVLSTTYAELQALRPYYAFNGVKVDRYEFDGELRQVLLATRELDTQSLPPQAQSWQNLHTAFTHGLGVVSSQVNIANPEGQPVFLSRDIPPRGSEELIPGGRQIGIYYGEMNNPPYSIVNSQQPELHYETEGGQQERIHYDGEGGVTVGGYLRRLAFAIRFADPNFVLSGLIEPDSKVLFHRDVRDRVQRVAPFLTLDRDPYPVVIDDRLLWIQDAYTTSAFYPYSERLAIGGIGTVNYMRNSVKATVDAYDGTVTLYVVDEDDPVLRAWRSAFPAPFAPVSEAPEGLERHFRYPQDIFQAQAELFRVYHIPEADEFYTRADAWDIPRDAAQVANSPTLRQSPTTQQPQLDPYYLLMRLPGEETEEFVLIQPYLARNRPNMVAWLAGRSDPGVHGQLFSVQFPPVVTILGPQQAQARIEQNDDIAEYITLRDQAGSNVIRGNLLVIPVENSILYVQPLFIEAPQARIPQLERVAIVMGERVVFERSLGAALEALAGAAPPGLEDPDDPDDPDAVVDIDDLIRRAQDAFERAEAALRDGNLSGYQFNIQEARTLLERIAQERGIVIEEEVPPEDEVAPVDENGDGEGEGG